MDQALCIGISTYPPPANSLAGVAHDIEGMKELLGGTGGSFSNVTVLRDADATKSRVERLVGQAFDAELDDTVLVYLAGHGGVDSSGAFFFMPYDMPSGAAAAEGVPLAWIRERFEACPASRVLLCLDCCRAGGIVHRSDTSPPHEVMARALKISGGTGKIILAACGQEQGAGEGGHTPHGHFTGAFLSGLRGEAADAEDRITVNSLADFIGRSLARLGGQELIHHGSVRGVFELRHVPSSRPVAASTTREGIDSSGALTLLDDVFFDHVETSEWQEPTRSTGTGEVSGSVRLRVPALTSEIAAALQRLVGSNPYGRHEIDFAHGSRGGAAAVQSASSGSSGGKEVWTVDLRLMSPRAADGLLGSGIRMNGRDISGGEIATRRVEVALLGEENDASTRLGFGDDPLAFVGGPRVPEGGPLLAAALDAAETTNAASLQRARLRLIAGLLRGGYLDRIQRLALTPIDDAVEIELVGESGGTHGDPAKVEICRSLQPTRGWQAGR